MLSGSASNRARLPGFKRTFSGSGMNLHDAGLVPISGGSVRVSDKQLLLNNRSDRLGRQATSRGRSLLDSRGRLPGVAENSRRWQHAATHLEGVAEDCRGNGKWTQSLRTCRHARPHRSQYVFGLVRCPWHEHWPRRTQKVRCGRRDREIRRSKLTSCLLRVKADRTTRRRTCAKLTTHSSSDRRFCRNTIARGPLFQVGNPDNLTRNN